MRFPLSPARRHRALAGSVGAALLLLGAAEGGQARAQHAATATVFVSPTGSDSGPCSRAQPCQSFDRAYHVARPGDVIQIAGGQYPPQTITVDRTKVSASSDVVFQPAAGGTVQIDGDLIMYGSHAVFRGSRAPYDFRLRILYSEATAGPTTSNNVTFENLDGNAFLIGPNRYVTIKGGDWGPNTGPGTEENKVGPNGNIGNQWPDHIVLDGLYVHDQNSTDLSVQHMGGLFWISGHDIVLRNSRFERNVVYNIQVQDFTSPECCGMTFGPMHDVVIENNVFAHPVEPLPDGTTNDKQPDLQLDPRHGGCWSNWLIRNNSFENGLAVGTDSTPCFANFRVVRNIGQGPESQCFRGAPGLGWIDNVWASGEPCGASDRHAPFGYAVTGTRLAPTGRPAAAVRSIFRHAAAGWSVRRIVRSLAGARAPAPSGSWRAAAVRGILADRAYLGGRYGASGTNPSIVGPRLWGASRKALR